MRKEVKVDGADGYTITEDGIIYDSSGNTVKQMCNNKGEMGVYLTIEHNDLVTVQRQEYFSVAELVLATYKDEH